MGLFVSDAFHEALKKNKIKYFKEKYCEEVDEPWVQEENLGPLLAWLKDHDLPPTARRLNFLKLKL